jgi:DNA-binding NarL/FixJ family response regulator
VIRVALVDDQAIVRAGVARILSPEDGFDVVAECADGREAVERLPEVAPDVVLMDIRMPRLDGVEATRQLAGLTVLVLTTFGEDDVLWGALQAGAAGFVLKDASAEDLIAAVRAVAAGGAWFDPGEQPQRLTGAQPVRQRRALQLRPDERSQPVAVARRVEPEHPHRAAVPRPQPLQDLDGGRLAGAVAAGEAEHLAGAHRERHAAQHGPRAIGLVEVANLDRRVDHAQRRYAA